MHRSGHVRQYLLRKESRASSRLLSSQDYSGPPKSRNGEEDMFKQQKRKPGSELVAFAGRFSAMASALLGLSVFVLPGMAQTCPVNTPHIQGVWRTLPYLMPINPISATLLHTGEVLIVAGSENDGRNNSPGAESYRNAIWDPTGTTQSSITVQQINYD